MNWISERLGRVEDWATERFDKIPTPTEEQLRPWQACRTLTDLGRCTADWLTGAIDFAPWSIGPPHSLAGRPPKMTKTSGALDAMAAVNQAGVFVTVHIDPDDLRAGVAGYVPDAAVAPIEKLAAEKGLVVHTRHGVAPPTNPFRPTCGWPECSQCVCLYAADDAGQLDFYEKFNRHRMLAESTVDLLERAWQVQIYDPEPNRIHRLYPALDRMAKEVRP